MRRPNFWAPFSALRQRDLCGVSSEGNPQRRGEVDDPHIFERVFKGEDAVLTKFIPVCIQKIVFGKTGVPRFFRFVLGCFPGIVPISGLC